MRCSTCPNRPAQALTDEVLRSALGPLIQLIEQSTHVSDAAIIPVTAFGFGKAVLHHGWDRPARSAGVGRRAVWGRADLAIAAG